jgi:hypothetical protein
MPNARNRIKASGDTHLPEVEADEFEVQGAHPRGAGTDGIQTRDRSPDGKGDPPRGGNKGGVMTDGENPTSDR